MASRQPYKRFDLNSGESHQKELNENADTQRDPQATDGGTVGFPASGRGVDHYGGILRVASPSRIACHLSTLQIRGLPPYRKRTKQNTIAIGKEDLARCGYFFCADSADK
eukprot:GHVO01053200.1.p2 GENE.GHVO01053200.1~~GHVO01053200.1.p2  ORF type:complete len:110 (-),score=17.06 GHVO01053200.1:104-433(-)